MIFVLEGPDGAGKSVLAQRLQSRLGEDTLVLRAGPPTSSDPLELYVAPLAALRGAHQHIIFDRWHVGELIYGPVLRGRSLLSPGQATYVELVLRTLGATFVHVTCEYDTLLDRFTRRGDDLVPTARHYEIYERYERYLGDRPHWLTFQTDQPHSIDDLIALGEEPSLPHYPGYLGPAKPDVLLLGDRRHVRARWHSLEWPFGPAGGTSGLWLFDNLAAAEVDVQHLGIVNACELTSSQLGHVHASLGYPRTVALGRLAQAAATRVGLTCGYVHHPQYARRFHHHSGARYVVDLVAAAGLSL